MAFIKKDLKKEEKYITFQRNRPPFFERLGILITNLEDTYMLEKKAEYYLEKINFLLKSDNFSEPVQLNITKTGDCLTTYKIDNKRTYLGYYDLRILEDELRTIIQNLIEIKDNKKGEIDYEKELLKKYLKNKENGKKIFELCLRYIKLIKRIQKQDDETYKNMTNKSQFCFP